MKIGFFDSGIGGLSVMHLALKYLPKEEFIFYADEEHVPYGEKTVEQIKEYLDTAIEFMIGQDVKAVVVACNTATSAAIDEMRDKYTIPIIGMEPAVKKALDEFPDQKVLVVATPVTVQGKKLHGLIERVDQQHMVDLVALPELVHYAENGDFESDNIIELLKERFEAFDLEEYSSIVLGCTHFNYFKDTFRKVLPSHVKFVDGNEGTVMRLVEELKNIGKFEKNIQKIHYFYSGKKITEGNEFNRIQEYLRRLDRMLDIV